ncbi:Crp/Fnr family transcriptional regulator [Herbaspirillum rubrisubalbicans]|uniref:Crp/Fnr family transcriptional regulator n=1 Tax=Herbaspirillum rubrisubalbicans TaxID=80842 RepID=A0AAD0UCJ9_9BURK|nr:Crp/Fnr family transcriptional regulator [Herbaspirillum rubrisubalbicans]AYR27003.1 Crp/Fnr family transcriptional regulator [Herbaspirillum rubrisubalbicans]MCP1572869.1 CRP-like cAMP-binding protein [Herbaspirillum rubrisubalbicans]RAM67157.1 Crp/Fnr family transcriptional regulator [Herbaspirillum rubrisubalbicans]RAN47589.1 Crp/Fnr family transcriptional regulator [Herbaspirillum rubrisubalbicans]
MQTTIRQMLSRSIWAQALTEEQLTRVESEVVSRKIAAGGYVCRKGDPVTHWIGVHEGLLKMSSVSPEGKTVSFAGMANGGWLGEGSLLKDEPRKYDVVALRESELLYMPKSTYIWLLDNSIPFNRFLVTQLNERLALFISLVEYDRMLEPDARVARCLAALFNPYLNPGIGLNLQISQEEVGNLSGTSRQRANQALQVLEKAGLLKVDYGSITINDLDGLRQFPG